jgi:hypothetical protein
MKAALKRRFAVGALLAGVAWATAGCGGFNGTYSASPAMLLIQHKPAPAAVGSGTPEMTAAHAGGPGVAASVISVD